MATVTHRHLTFQEAAGFLPGQTRFKRVNLAVGFLFEKAVYVSATPFDSSSEDRRLRVIDVVVRTRPDPLTSPVVEVTVESLGPDAPTIWYLDFGIIEP